MPKARKNIQKIAKTVRKAGSVDPAAGKTTVKIAAAKGRPMLTWVGKRPLGSLPAFPAQLVEKFETAPVRTATPSTDWPAKYPAGGLLFHGDNKEVLAHLLANGFRGKVQLIYIDPPFDSGADYVRKVSLRGPAGSTKIDGTQYTLGEQIQYTDIWANDNYLQFMYERLLLLKELLNESGLIAVHLDESRVHHLKVIIDEIFGAERFINEVIWKRQTAHSDVGQGAKHLGRLHDSLLLYGKSERFVWNDLFTPYSEEYVSKFYQHAESESGRRYTLSDLTAPGGSGKGNPYYEFLGVTRYWRFNKKRMVELFEQGLVLQAAPGAVPRQKRYLDEMRGVPLQSIWDDVRPIQSQAGERLDYPTQKPSALIERLVRLGSNPSDVVLDCFIGSGTTAAAAQRLGRRWIGCDINKGAIQTTAKRIQEIMREQQADRDGVQQQQLIGEPDASAKPAQLGFSVWRVNDYDLQIQHNEAVNLACEHLGVQRTKADNYFDGTLGRSLVKIVPFDHPLSPLDVEELKRELDARKEEDRSIAFVCVGMEQAAQPIIDDWNRHRKGKNAANKIEVIELRRDAKHGGWLNHMPARADVSITRKGSTVVVQIEDFISPSIVERLRQQAGILEPKIDDCRAMIDSVAIDANYDGRVFNISFMDVPERKTDYVQGRYELPAPAKGATVAVRITDMLGEEVLVTKPV